MLILNIKGLKNILQINLADPLLETKIETIKEISNHIDSLKTKVSEMTECRKIANAMENTEDKATKYNKSVKPFINDIRNHIDKLELIVDDELWTLPKYRKSCL